MTFWQWASHVTSNERCPGRGGATLCSADAPSLLQSIFPYSHEAAIAPCNAFPNLLDERVCQDCLKQTADTQCSVIRAQSTPCRCAGLLHDIPTAHTCAWFTSSEGIFQSLQLHCKGDQAHSRQIASVLMMIKNMTSQPDTLA